MLNLNSVMLGSSQPKVMAEFYEKIFEKKPDYAEGEWFGWTFGGFSLNIGEHSEVKGKSKEPQRVIFNLETADTKKDFERIKEFAEVIKEPYEMEGWEGNFIATLADPDGNYFQLMPHWEEFEENK